jgi:hypothetical protein
MQANSDGRGRLTVLGALAGASSAFAFAMLHAILISDIWFALVLMLAAGALCGACLGWSYTVMVPSPSLSSWITYNLLFDTMFVLLGIVSVLVFQPTMSMAALMALNGPPDDLIAQAMPVTAIFTLLMSVVVGVVYGFSWRRLAAALLSSTVLVLLLGLNVSVIGLVSIPRGSWYLVVEMLGLILVLNLVYVLVFIGLGRDSLLHGLLTDQRDPA